MQTSATRQRICPHPEYETVVCPACETEIRGVVAEGTSEEPVARCPACEKRIESVLIP